MLLYGRNPAGDDTLESVRLDLPTGPEAPAAVRAHLSEVLERWGRGDLCETACLCGSEIVTHLADDGLEALELHLMRSRTRILVELVRHGAGARFEDLLTGQPDRARSVGVVDDLVPLWGVRPIGDGDAIWFELH